MQQRDVDVVFAIVYAGSSCVLGVVNKKACYLKLSTDPKIDEYFSPFISRLIVRWGSLGYLIHVSVESAPRTFLCRSKGHAPCYVKKSLKQQKNSLFGTCLLNPSSVCLSLCCSDRVPGDSHILSMRK